MSRTSAVLMFAGSFATAPALCQQTSAPDLQAVAHNLVASTMLQEGQNLLITGSTRDAPLMEHLAIEAMKQGLHPMLSIWSERLTRRSFDEVPSAYDTLPPKLDLALVNIFDGQISIDIGETEGVLAGVPPERTAARGRVGAQVNEAFMRRRTHFVNLGNGLYPTATLAKRLGVPQPQLAEEFWKAVAVSPAQIAAVGDRLHAALATGATVRVTHPNGTDITFRVSGQSFVLSSGAITAAQLSQSGSPVTTWLPAGEFAAPAVTGSAQGKIVIDKSLWNGQLVNGLTLVFSGGKLTGMTAVSGLEAIRRDFDAAGAGKDLFAGIDIGLNPALNLPLATGAIVWPQGGAVSLGLGNDTFTGGSNNTNFGYFGQLAGATVFFDGKPVVQDGRLH